MIYARVVLPEAGGTGEEDVVEGFVPFARRGDKDLQIGL